MDKYLPVVWMCPVCGDTIPTHAPDRKNPEELQWPIQRGARHHVHEGRVVPCDLMVRIPSGMKEEPKPKVGKRVSKKTTTR